MRIWKYFLVLLLGVLTFGCGGGGGGNDSQGAGSVTMLIGDGPIDDLAAAYLWVNEVRFNMAGGNETVALEMPQKIELLQLENITELLLIEQVPAGKINKIRLNLDDLRIVRKSDPDTEIMLPVPAGGWVELNPQGGIDVLPGQTIYVTLDMPVDSSVQVVANGNGEYRFRPEIFAELSASRLVRLTGTARGVNDTTDGFDLCDLQRPDDDGPNNLIDCIHVNDANAVIVENGATLEENVTVTAFGFMDPDADEPTLNAEVLVTGTAEAIIAEKGTATAVPPADPMVLEQLDPMGMPFDFDVHLLPDTKSFPANDGTTPPVMEMDRVEAFGFSTGDTSMDSFLFVYKRPPPA